MSFLLSLAPRRQYELQLPLGGAEALEENARVHSFIHLCFHSNTLLLRAYDGPGTELGTRRPSSEKCRNNPVFRELPF